MVTEEKVFHGKPVAVSRRVSARRFQAWCAECQEGINDTRESKTQKWCDKHNEERHPA